MKKTLLIALAAIATIFTSCSSDITNDNDDSNNGQGKGMTLIANVEQDDTRANFDPSNTFGKWSFAYTDNDNVVVGNNQMDNTFYKFTKNGDTFSSTEAQATKTDANWYAYYPGTTIDLTNQAGTKESAAQLYALAGATTAATTGADGLAINMRPQAAVLRIVKVDNYGPCDIYLKTADGKFVKGLKAKKNEAGYEVETSETKVSVLYKESTGNAGIYYVIVPAGVKISVYNTNDENHIKTTKAAGLTPGRYYTLTTGPTTGKETATLADGTTEPVDWVQLWIGGPRFAVKNVADAMTWDEATKKDDDFAWGSNWYVPSEEDLKIMDELLLQVQTSPAERKVSIAGYPTLELITDTKDEENIVKITCFQPGYNNNSISLYNKINSGLNTYRLWTATEKDGYGVEFCILEMNNWFYGGGFCYRTTKNEVVLTRPILTAKTILWSNQYVSK